MNNKLISTKYSWATILQWLAFLILTIFCIYSYSYYLNWEFGFDSNVFLYMSKLFEFHHKLPYKDIYELNYIGANLFYYGIAKIFGFSSYAYKIFDLFFMVILGISTYQIMPRYRPIVRLLVIMTFFALYLGTWPKNNLQRDYLVLLPLCWCYYILAIKKVATPLKDLSLIGLMVGLMMIIKPNMIFYAPFLYWGYHHYRGIPFPKFGFSLVIGLLVLQMFQPMAFKLILDRYISAPTLYVINLATLFIPAILLALSPLLRLSSKIRHLLVFFFLCSLPTILCIILMKQMGVLDSFIELATDYWVLYFRLDTYMDSEATYGKLFSRFIVSMTQIADYGYILIPGIIALAVKKYYQHKDYFPLILFTLASYFNVIAMHKFFPYHYFPLIYFCLIAMGVLFRWPESNDNFRPLYRFSVGFTVFNILVQLVTVFGYTLYHAQLYKWSTDELVEVMKKETEGKQDIKIQPLGWVMMGGIKTMEVLNADLPTRYIFTNFLYHHVTHPFTQRKQKEFLAEFNRSNPDYLLIEPAPSYIYKEQRPETLFPEFHKIIEERYFRFFPKENVINRTQIWKRKN